MGLAVDDDDSPSPPPASPPPVWQHPHHHLFHPGPHALGNPMALAGSPPNPGLDLPATLFGLSAAAAASLTGKAPPEATFHHHPMSSTLFNRKRQFDVASLLAPEKESGGAVSPNSYKSDEQDRDQSLSSPSPPPASEGTLKRSKIYKRATDFGSRHDSSDDDDKSIEVTEDDNMEKPHHHHFSRKCHSSGIGEYENDDVSGKLTDSDHKVNHRNIHGDDSESSRGASPPPESQMVLSPKDKNMKMLQSMKMGQCGTSSNDEEDSTCKSQNYGYLSGLGSNRSGLGHQHGMMLSRPERLSVNSNNGATNHDSDSIPGGGLLVGQNNLFPNNNLQMLNQQNLMNHAAAVAAGNLPPLEFLQAHHLAQQQSQSAHPPQGPPPPVPLFGMPGSHQFLQQNPSLASLMLLSSKYRELTMNAAVKRPQP